MDFFMDCDYGNDVELTIPGIAKVCYPAGHEKAGQPIPWILKPITTERLSQLTDNNTTKIRKEGKINKVVDDTRLTNDIMVETIVYPNFKDTRWLEQNKLVDPIDLLMRVLSLPGDYSRISKEVVKANGMGDSTEEIIKEAKN